jgi:hypothetical protein
MNRSALNPSGNTIGRIESGCQRDPSRYCPRDRRESGGGRDTFAARPVLLRLMAEGLDRHEALHAIGSVLSGQLLAALRDC